MSFAGGLIRETFPAPADAELARLRAAHEQLVKLQLASPNREE